MKPIILLLLCVSVAIPSCIALTETVYSPSSKVKEYHYYQFSADVSYVRQLIVRPAVLLVVGFVVVLLFVCWGLYRCCSCCGCRKASVKEGGDNWRTFYTILAIALTAGCVAMIIYGFDSNSKQNKAFNDVIDLIDIVIKWKDDTVAAVKKTLNSTDLFLAHVEELKQADPHDVYIPANDKNQLSSSINSTRAPINSISSKIDSLDVSSFRSRFADSINKANTNRNLVIILALSILLVCTLLALYFALADAYFSKACQPRRYCVCRCLVLLLVILTLVVVLIAWIVAALLLISSLAMADYCIAPTTNTIDVFSIKSDLVIYYLRCNEGGLANPYAADFVQIQFGFTTAKTKLAQVQTVFNTQYGGAFCSLNTTCSSLNTTLGKMQQDLEVLNGDIGYDTNLDGEYESGLLKMINCQSVNGMYQAFLNLFCDSAFLAISSCFETFVAFACFIVIAEFIRRKLPANNASAVSPAPESKSTELPEYSKEPPPVPVAYPAGAVVLPLSPLMQPGAPVPALYGGGSAVYPFHAGPPFQSNEYDQHDQNDQLQPPGQSHA